MRLHPDSAVTAVTAVTADAAVAVLCGAGVCKSAGLGRANLVARWQGRQIFTFLLQRAGEARQRGFYQ